MLTALPSGACLFNEFLHLCRPTKGIDITGNGIQMSLVLRFGEGKKLAPGISTLSEQKTLRCLA